MGPGSRVAAPHLDERLLGQRIVVLGQEIDDEVAHAVCSRLVLLAAEDRRRDITLYVDATGGSPGAATAIHDTMQWVEPDVVTVVHGTAAAAGALVAAAGAPGRRTALPHARFLLHHVSGGLGPAGSAADVRGRSDELTRRRRELAELIAARCGRPVDAVAADVETGRWFTPAEAVAYGLADRVAAHSGREIDSRAIG